MPLIGSQRLNHPTCRSIFLHVDDVHPLRPFNYQLHMFLALDALQAVTIRDYSGEIRPYHTGAGSLEN